MKRFNAVFSGHEVPTFDRLESVSVWLEREPTLVVMFVDWCCNFKTELFDTRLINLWNCRSIPMNTWQPFLCASKHQPGITKLVNNHTFDDYLNEFSDRMKIWLAGNDGIYGNEDDRRAYLRFAHEMNRKWDP